MTNKLSFFLPIVPKPKSNRLRIGRGFAYEEAESKANEKALIAEAMQFRPSRPLSGFLWAEYEFRFPWRKGEKKVDRDRGWAHHNIRPDDGNLIKRMDDVLQDAGIIVDDAMICVHVSKKIRSDNPGVRVDIWRIEDD